MAKVAQIGAGLVGKAMALDLAKKHNVFLSDFNDKALKEVQFLNQNIVTSCFDLNDTDRLIEFVSETDIVLVAVPGSLGFETVQKIIECKKDIVDISFARENLMLLNSKAKKNEITVIYDAGVAPGIPNFILGALDKNQKILSFQYFVGGLPMEPKPPYNYKAPFSPFDVIEEYTRPARIMRKGKILTLPALSEIVEKKYDRVGNLEAFNSDGLRSILTTMGHIPNMLEKTLRYPGHADLIKRELESNKIQPNNEKSLEKLFEDWKLNHGEKEFTILDIKIECELENYNYLLYDQTDDLTSISSMARTTGYTATATVNFLLEKGYNQYGVFPPEIISGETDIWMFINRYLKTRGIHISERTLEK